jgi:beta-glucanase (GH16 family)
MASPTRWGVSRGTGLEMEEWHTYAAKWTSGQVCWYIDGQRQGCVNAFDSTNQPMHLLFDNWNTEWEDENMPNADTRSRGRAPSLRAPKPR